MERLLSWYWLNLCLGDVINHSGYYYDSCERPLEGQWDSSVSSSAAVLLWSRWWIDGYHHLDGHNLETHSGVTRQPTSLWSIRHREIQLFRVIDCWISFWAVFYYNSSPFLPHGRSVGESVVKTRDLEGAVLRFSCCIYLTRCPFTSPPPPLPRPCPAIRDNMWWRWISFISFRHTHTVCLPGCLSLRRSLLLPCKSEWVLWTIMYINSRQFWQMIDGAPSTTIHHTRLYYTVRVFYFLVHPSIDSSVVL